MSPTPIQRGIVDPQAGTPSSDPIVVRGFTNDETFIENVSAPAGSLLVVYLILFSDGSLIPDSNVQLDGVDMTRSPFIDGYFDSSRTVLVQVYTTALVGALSSGLVNIFESEPGLQALAAYVFSVETGATGYTASGDDSNDLPRPGPVDCPITVPASAIVMLADFQQNNLVTGDAYTSGGVLLRSDHLTGGVDTGMMSFAVFASPGTGVQHFGRELHNPPRPYFGHAMAFS